MCRLSLRIVARLFYSNLSLNDSVVNIEVKLVEDVAIVVVLFSHNLVGIRQHSLCYNSNCSEGHKNFPHSNRRYIYNLALVCLTNVVHLVY